MIIFSWSEIEARVVLVATILSWQSELYFLDVGNAIKPTSCRLRVDKDRDVLTNCARWRSNVESAADDTATIWIVAEYSATWSENVDNARRDPRGSEDSGSYAAGTKLLYEGPEFGCFDKASTDTIRSVAQAFVREEEE